MFKPLYEIQARELLAAFHDGVCSPLNADNRQEELLLAVAKLIEAEFC